MSQTGAHSQWRSGSGAAEAPAALYLSETATGVYELTDTAADADAVLVLDTGVVQIDSDTGATGAISLVQLGSTVYLRD